MSKKWKWIIGLLFVGVVLGGALAVSSMWVMHKNVRNVVLPLLPHHASAL